MKSSKTTQRTAQLQVLKGLRDFKLYVALLEKHVYTAKSDGLGDIFKENPSISLDSVNLGKDTLNYSIKGLTNKVNN